MQASKINSTQNFELFNFNQIKVWNELNFKDFG